MILLLLAWLFNFDWNENRAAEEAALAEKMEPEILTVLMSAAESVVHIKTSVDGCNNRQSPREWIWQ